MKTYETPAGKVIALKRTPHGMVEIYFTTGGELPEELSGIFTSEDVADIAVRCYLTTKEKSDAPKQARKTT